MKILMRILLFLYSLCIGVLAGLLIIGAIIPRVVTLAYTSVQDYYMKSFSNKAIIVVVVIAFFLISVYFLIHTLKVNKKIRSISRNTDIGQISISLSSIENLIVTSVRGTAGIREIKAIAKKKGQGLFIVLRLGVFDDSNLPNFTEDIQRKVKTLVENSTGIVVRFIKLQVEKIHANDRVKKKESNEDIILSTEKLVPKKEEEPSDG